MIKTIPADYIGESNLGYAIVALPSEQTKAGIVALLDDLTNELPGILWRMPPEQMHLTLCEIIQPKAYTQDKEWLYNLPRQEYENTLSEIFSTLPRFSIILDITEASPQAIIARSSDPTSFNKIRTQLSQKMQLPVETRTPPDIIHSSIARYLKETDLDKVQEALGRYNISLNEDIAEFKLLRTTVMPLQEFEILKTYPLA